MRPATGRRCDDAVNPDADTHLFGQEVEPRDLRHLQGGPLHEVGRRPRRGERPFREHPLERSAFRRQLRLHDRQSALRQGTGSAIRTPCGPSTTGARLAASAPGLPRISDGPAPVPAAHARARQGSGPGRARGVAIIMNGSPLFTGDSGSGESEIRRWILENDLLEALIALPEQLFYNTGIATYVWVLTNRKRPERRRKVQLIDATSFWVQLRKSLGGQTARGPVCAEGAHPAAAGGLRGRRDPAGRPGRRGARSRRQPPLSDHPVRLPEDHGRTAAPARFPGQPRADRAARRRARLRQPGDVAQEGCRESQGQGGGTGAAGRDPSPAPESAGRGLSGTGRPSRPHSPRQPAGQS